MSLLSLFWFGCILVGIWFFLADLVGAIRYAYPPLAWRSIAVLLGVGAAFLELLGLATDLTTALLIIALLWSNWFYFSKSFQHELDQRGIRPSKLLWFQKP